jgi:hypothetical protein
VKPVIVETIEKISGQKLQNEILKGRTCDEYIKASRQGDDVDGDGIPDFVERSITQSARKSHTGYMWSFDPMDQSCDCADRLTCWLDPDSDDDGITDELDGGIFSDHGAAFLEANGPVLFNPMDTDADGIPDARDFDSDGDGVGDGLEDRQPYFFPAVDDYLMTDAYPCWEYYFGITGEGERILCTLDENAKYIVGAEHGMYLVTRLGTRVVIPLRCTNVWLNYCSDFNGSFDESSDTSDPKRIDSDGDGFCDGDGPACEGMPKDTCPWQAASPGSADGC